MFNDDSVTKAKSGWGFFVKPSPDGASLSSQVRMGLLCQAKSGWGFFVKPSQDGNSLSSQVRMGLLCQAYSGWGFFVKKGATTTHEDSFILL